MADSNPLVQDDDVQLQMPQDDFDASASTTDPVIDESGDDPTSEMGMSPDDMKKELNAIDSERPDDDSEYVGGEDARENVEDNDENAGQGGA